MVFKLITIPISSLILERFGWNSDKNFKACKNGWYKFVKHNLLNQLLEIVSLSWLTNLQGCNNYVGIFVVKK